MELGQFPRHDAPVGVNDLLPLHLAGIEIVRVSEERHREAVTVKTRCVRTNHGTFDAAFTPLKYATVPIHHEVITKIVDTLTINEPRVDVAHNGRCLIRRIVIRRHDVMNEPHLDGVGEFRRISDH